MTLVKPQTLFLLLAAVLLCASCAAWPVSSALELSSLDVHGDNAAVTVFDFADSEGVFAGADPANATSTPSPSATFTPEPEPTNDDWKTAIALSVAGVVGLLFLTLGYRLFRITIAIITFASVGLLTYYITNEHISTSTLVAVLVSIGIGLVVAVLAYIFWRLAVPFIGMLLGVVFTAIVISSPAANTLSSDGAVYGLLVPVMLILAAASYFMVKFFIVLTTCSIGSLGFISIIDHFVASGFTEGFYAGIGRIFQTHYFFGLYISYDSLGWNSADDKELDAYLMLGGFALLAAIGAAVQLLFTARSFHHEKRSEGIRPLDVERSALLSDTDHGSSSPYNTLGRNASVNNHASTRNTMARKWGIDDKTERL